MPRLWSLVIGIAAPGASTGATQTLRTPSSGASQESRLPSGEMRACAFVGLPNRWALGIRGMGMALGLATLDEEADAAPADYASWCSRLRAGCRTVRMMTSPSVVLSV